MMETIKKEMVTNDEQRNYIEILKQAIESSLIKTGLKTKIDLLKLDGIYLIFNSNFIINF